MDKQKLTPKRLVTEARDGTSDLLSYICEKYIHTYMGSIYNMEFISLDF